MRLASFRLASSFALLSLSLGSLALLALGGAACTSTVRSIDLGGGDASPTDPALGAGTGAGTKTDGGSSTSGGTLCEQVCAKAASASCSKQSSCVADCEADQKKVPDGCKAQAEDALECAATKATKFECSSSGKPLAKDGCETESKALVDCVLGGGKTDAGPKDCGNLSSGSAACDTCVNASCCAEAAACSGDAACTNILDCFSSCTNSACYTTCENANPTGVAKERAFYGCLDSKCASACQ